MKDKISGVGSSIGLDRLIAGLEQLGKTNTRKSYLDAEIFCTDAALSAAYQKAAAQLRTHGIACEVFPDAKKIGQQYAYAEKKGVPFAILMNQSDAKNGTMSVKSMATRQQFDNLTAEQAAAIIRDSK